ncbi:MAG TPA: hypothetical protein ENI85_02565 [Deltaproteobacteria bacterium]|nr:hypothetical protein [Deltaproteobacteria bacterium]
MPIDDELIEILACPETRQPVTLAPAEILDKLNSEIDAGRLRNRGGDVVGKRIEEGLVREDGKVLYIIEDDIPIMLIDQSIELATGS